MTDATRAGLVTRNTRLLVGAQVMLWGSAGAFAAFGPITVFDISHRESLVGVMLALTPLQEAGPGRWPQAQAASVGTVRRATGG